MFWGGYKNGYLSISVLFSQKFCINSEIVGSYVNIIKLMLSLRGKPPSQRAITGLHQWVASGGYSEVGHILLYKGANVNAAPVPSSRETALKFDELLLSCGVAGVKVENKVR